MRMRWLFSLPVSVRGSRDAAGVKRAVCPKYPWSVKQDAVQMKRRAFV